MMVCLLGKLTNRKKKERNQFLSTALTFMLQGQRRAMISLQAVLTRSDLALHTFMQVLIPNQSLALAHSVSDTHSYKHVTSSLHINVPTPVVKQMF